MKLTNVYGVTNGQTVCAYIAYVTNTNQLIQQKIAAFNNSEITDFTSVTSQYKIPSNDNKQYNKFLLSNKIGAYLAYASGSDGVNVANRFKKKCYQCFWVCDFNR
jgi:hypothetical protein